MAADDSLGPLSDSESLYYDAILEYEQRIDRGESIDLDDFLARYQPVANRLHAYLQQRRNAADWLGPAGGRKQPEFIHLQSFGHYSVLELMDWGGNASIHKVEDTRFGRTAALKIPLKMWAADSQALQRLRREARLSGRLQHPHIVPIYDVGTTQTVEGELPYFTMRLVIGRPLSEVLKARRDPQDDQFRYILLFRQVCQAMAYAHQQQILHRDLKPGNVMVGDFDDAYVMDWGYAKDLRGGYSRDPVETRPLQELLKDLAGADDMARTIVLPTAEASVGDDDDDRILGTPCYLPPEIARQRAGAADRRSDVFCLGGILCAILTGEPTYRSADILEVSRLAYAGNLDETFARLRSCGANPALIELACACLAPDPGQRPADARVVADRVSEYIHGQEQAKLDAERNLRHEAQARAEAESQNRVTAEAKFVAERTSRRLTVLLATSLVAIVCIAAGTLWQSVHSAQLARRAETAREVQRRLESAAALEREFDPAALTSQDDLARALELWRRHQALVEQAASTLQAGEPSGDLEQAIAAARSTGTTSLETLQSWATLLRDLDAAADLTALSIDEYAPSQALVDQAFSAAFSKFGLGSPEDSATFVTEARRIPARLRQHVAATIDRWAVSSAGRGRDRFALATQLLDQPPAWRQAIMDDTLDVAGVQTLLTAAEADPRQNTPSLFQVCADKLRTLKAVEVALEVNARARDRFRDDYSLHLQAGILNSFTTPERYEQAESGFRAALATSPDSPAALAALGFVTYKLGRIPQSTALLKRSLELQPSFPWALSTLGRIELTVVGNYESAQSLFERALAVYPQYATAADGLVMCYAMRGQAPLALRVYRQLGLDPEQSAFQDLARGMKAMTQSRFHDASALFEKFLASPMAQGQNQRALVPMVMMLRGDLEDADSHARTLIADASISPLDRILLGVTRGFVAMLEGRSRDARVEFDAMQELAPGYFLPQLASAIVSLYEGRAGEARARLAEIKSGEWLPVPTLHGLLVISLDSYLKITDLFFGPAEKMLEEPTLAGVRRRVLDSSGFHIFYIAEFSLLRQRGVLALAIYHEMLTTFPVSAFAGTHSFLSFLKNPTHRLNGLRAVGLVTAGRATDQHEFQPDRFPKLQAEAQQWLAQEIRHWRRISRTPNGRVRAKIWVHFCQRCPDLAGIRDAEFLEKLSPEVRAEWTRLWAEIEQLRLEWKQPIVVPAGVKGAEE